MKPPIAGVAPEDVAEVTAMTVWPSNSAYSIGRWFGRLYEVEYGWYIFRVGNLIAVLSIPIALVLFFARLAPWIGIRYRLTNRRVIVQRGIRGVDETSVDLGGFDSIEVVVQPGQQWYHAGDLVFRNGTAEVLRLRGVSRPEAFRQTCLKSHAAYTMVKDTLARQSAPA